MNTSYIDDVDKYYEKIFNTIIITENGENKILAQITATPPIHRQPMATADLKEQISLMPRDHKDKLFGWIGNVLVSLFTKERA